MNKTSISLLILLLVLNLLSMLLYLIDKQKSKKGAGRISEDSLLLSSFLGGIGAFLGMQIFRHKTKHLKFKISVPLFSLLHIGLILLICSGTNI